MSLNNEKIIYKIIEDKIAIREKTAGLYTEQKLFGFELSVLESVIFRKNIPVPKHVK